MSVQTSGARDAGLAARRCLVLCKLTSTPRGDSDHDVRRVQAKVVDVDRDDDEREASIEMNRI